MHRRISHLSWFAALLSAALIFSSASVAAAAPFDTWIRANDAKITSGSCRYVPFKVHHDAGYLDRFTAEVEVWRGRQYLDTTFDYVYDSNGPLRGELFWCPFYGLGKFRLGPTTGEWDDYDADQEGSYRDRSKDRLLILQASRFRDMRASRRGNTRTVSGRLMYFDIGVEAWRRAPRGIRISLQRETNSGWQRVGRARTRSGGLVSVSTRSSTKRVYRLVSPQTKKTWSAKSPTIRR